MLLPVHREVGFGALPDPVRYLSLRERVRWGASRGPAGEPSAAAAEALRGWRALPAFGEPAVWGERLRVLGVGEPALAAALEGRLDAEAPSEYRSFLAELVSHAPAEAPADRATAGFSDVLSPLDRLLRRRLGEALARLDLTHRAAIDERGVIDSFAANAATELREELAQALVAELHYAREAGLLEGATPEQRFADFAHRWTSDPEWIEYFFDDNPVLLRLSCRAVARFVEVFCEVVGHFDRDHDLLAGVLGVPAGDRLAALDGPKGDLHAGRRFVLQVVTSSGHKLVYKPRSLRTDVAFGGLLDWLVEHGFPMPFHRFRILDRGDHGWMEFVEARECEHADEVARFYERHGAYLALFYVLGGQDLIFDNIIAHGEHPCLIDLECLFAPLQPLSTDNAGERSAAARFFNESVIHTGLLPRWSAGDLRQPGINVSGLSALDGQRQERLPQWVDAGTDRMRQEHRDVHLSSQDLHLPRLGGAPCTIKDHAPALLRGFSRAYELLARHREELVAERGPLAAFGDCTVRVLIRPTNSYARVRHASLHPDCQEDAIAVDRIYEHCWNGHSERAPAEVIQSEIDQLWEGDIPYFKTTLDSIDLFDGAGTLIKRGYCLESCRAGAARRVARLSEEDHRRQVALIHQSLAIFESLEVSVGELPGLAEAPPAGAEPRPERAALLDLASSLADEILARGFEDDHELQWIDLALTSHGTWSQSIVPRGLYEGSDGIALFLVYLHELTGAPRYRAAAEKIARAGREEFLRAHERSLSGRGLSPFVFPFSSLYLLRHMSAAWGAPWLPPELLEQHLDWIARCLPGSTSYDLVFGSAGAIPVLLGLHGSLGSARALQLAVRCGDHLLQGALPEGGGACWPSRQFSRLGGLSHGTAGIAWALLQLAHETGEERFLEAGRRALIYDRSLYVPEAATWRDLRQETGTGISAWCHGSAGIGLSRLLLEPFVRDDALEGEQRVALEHVARSGFGISHCLCHGDLGNLEIALALARRLGRRDLEPRVAAHLALIVERGRAGLPWKSGMPGRDVDIMNLFMGLAGTGYGLLRFADWARVPSVLALEGPACEHACLHH